MAEQDPKHQQRIRIVEFHPEAQAELRADARFYEGRQLGLGDEFLDAVDWVITFDAAAFSTTDVAGHLCLGGQPTPTCRGRREHRLVDPSATP